MKTVVLCLASLFAFSALGTKPSSGERISVGLPANYAGHDVLGLRDPQQNYRLVHKKKVGFQIYARKKVGEALDTAIWDIEHTTLGELHPVLLGAIIRKETSEGWKVVFKGEIYEAVYRQWRLTVVPMGGDRVRVQAMQLELHVPDLSTTYWIDVSDLEAFKLRRLTVPVESQDISGSWWASARGGDGAALPAPAGYCARRFLDKN